MTKILLASHGSEGGVAAEDAAIAACHVGDTLDHLYVIPSWWADMTGDDWLNNGVSRNEYRGYIETELHSESKQVSNRIKAQCQLKKVNYRLKLIVGDGEQLLTSMGQNYEKIFIGSRRPKGFPGINDCMLTKQAHKILQNRLEIIAYPNG